MSALRGILLLFFFTALPAVSVSQAQDTIPELDSTEVWQTPFNPKAPYQTIGLRARVLPWVLGNAGGLNVLVGGEIGFLKNHSIAIDGSYYGDQDHHDSPPSENGKGPDNYNGSNRALFFAYNYHYNLRNLREQMGLSVYTGLNCRIGRVTKAWDRGISKDSVLQSDARYFSIGPQAGVILNFSEAHHFALNLNIAALYTTKNLSQQSTHGLVLSDDNYHFNTYDLKIGLNLYWWFAYKKT